MLLRNLVALGLALYSLSHAASQTIDAGRGEIPLTVPDDYDETKPAPLIVLLHGYTSSGAGQDSYLKISELANQYDFLFIAPDGTVEKSGDKNRFWNATEACCDFQGSEIDDSAYLRKIVEEIGKKYSVDQNRIYFIGHSNGGFMCHRMAQDHPDLIAAVACLNGAAPNEIKGERPPRPVHVLQIHGTVDRLNNYQGGDIQGVPYPGAMGTVQKWAAFNGLDTEPTSPAKKLDLDKNIAGDETTITQFDDGAVELWTMNEVGHIPAITDEFSKNIIEWLLAHTKAEK